MSIRRWPDVARSHRRDKPTASPPTDVWDFEVIGELKDNAHQLLLMGDDGRCYAYDLDGGEITLLEPDDFWKVDTFFPTSPRTRAATGKMAS